MAIDIENWRGVLDVTGLRQERDRLRRRLARVGVSSPGPRAGFS